MDINQTIKDLVAEQKALDDVVATLDNQMWKTPTSSDRWNVADQIGHLAYFDNAASLAITDPDKFRSSIDDL
ncbi:MAG: maleylpyruvate isomerase N-terminal domain-containing protein, partial [Acidimicrobiales bacterium]|nr:maleylpyruvate isomerase N-terminal domain-containing protein [Acidimicrobiales bacterium]